MNASNVLSWGVLSLTLCGCATIGFNGPGVPRSNLKPIPALPGTPDSSLSSPDVPSQSNRNPLPELDNLPADSASPKELPRGPVLQAPEASHNTSANPLAQREPFRRDPGSSSYKASEKVEYVSAPDRPKILDDQAWSRYFRSTDRRPIETMMIGKGPHRVLVTASLHGDEIQSIDLLYELASYLKQHPEEIPDSTVLLIRTPNPDGLFARSPYNVNGVDLNRNFPSENWRMLKNQRSGTEAGSETETKSFMRLMSDFRPKLILHIKDARDRDGLVNYEGMVAERADLVSRRLALKSVTDLGKTTSGSMENHALTKWKCPSITLLLPVESNSRAAWESNSAGLLSALAPLEDRPIAKSRPIADPAKKSPENQPSEQLQVRGQTPEPNPSRPSNRPLARWLDQVDEAPGKKSQLPASRSINTPPPKNPLVPDPTDLEPYSREGLPQETDKTPPQVSNPVQGQLSPKQATSDPFASPRVPVTGAPRVDLPAPRTQSIPSSGLPKTSPPSTLPRTPNVSGEFPVPVPKHGYLELPPPPSGNP